MLAVLPVPPNPELLTAGFAALPSRCLLLTLDWQVAAVSDAYLAATRTSRALLLGHSLFDVFGGGAGTPEADAMAGMRAALQQVVVSGQPQLLPVQRYRLEDPTTGLAGDEHYWQLLNSPLFDAAGAVVGVLHTVVEVAAQQQAEAQLRESQAREHRAQAEAERQRRELQRVFEQAPVAIAVYRGPRYRIELANPMVCRLWGRTPAQVLGKGLFDALPEVAGLGYEELLDGVLATGVPHVAHAMEAVHERDGRRETVYWDFVYLPTYAAEGPIDGVMVVATEVTAQVQARQQAQQLNTELEARVQERTAQLAEQQSLLQQILRQVPAAIATLSGPEHRFSFANSRYQDLVGHRVTVGQTVAEALPEVVEQGILELLDRVYQTGELFLGREIMLMLEQPPGPPHHRHYDLTYLPLRDGQGAVQGILVFAVEVSEQVRTRRQAATMQAELLASAQHQVQERQDLYQIFEQTPAAIVLLREPSHAIDYYNPAFAATFPPEAQGLKTLRGRTLAEVYPRMRQAGLIELLDRVYATGEPQVVLEMPLAALQPGSPRYVTFTYQAYREAGQLVGVAAFIYDATEQVLARQAQETQQRLVESIFAQAPTAIWVVQGPGYVFELVNPLMGQLLGHAPAQLLGRPYFEVLPELAAQGLPALFEQVWAQGEPVYIKELAARLARHAPHETGYFNFVFQPLRDEQGQVSRIACVAVDVTDQVKARQQVQQLNQELTATNAELKASNTRLTHTNADLDTFVYAASHDLKAPIANIEGLLHALRDYLPTQSPESMVPRLLGMMEQAVQRFQQTVGHLTTVASLQAPDAATETADLAAVLAAVQLDLQPLLESTRAELQVAGADCPPVRLSSKNLRSVLFNLLSNALKYRAAQRPPLVQVRAHATAGQLVLAVQDNGLGLSEEQQGQLFTMFRRLHSHVEGSGVGLYLLKRLVENAGGTVTVQSELGVGSTFIVTLPLA